tara:strand:- start:658 stop:846 length:189 start_codon:yes stop_codon:yes gene_type:complete
MSIGQYKIKDEKKLYEEIMNKYNKMSDKTLKRVVHILDTGNIEGLCMPEFIELVRYLQGLDK